ncbi:MAG TPA: hypothetical protein ENJ82_13465 [Bacteroidetes bacterium]|nr:hypothetical protein [Bacteroidota bacterium]
MPNRLLLFCFSILALTVMSCGNRTLVFAGEAEPENFSLSFKMPEEFDFEILEGAEGKHDFALEVTYFSEQMQGWDQIPLYYILTSPTAESDKRISIPVKDQKDWRGTLLANEHDRIFEQDIATGLDLAAGKYNLKLYGDSKDEGKPILGIVKVTFKVYSGK